MTLSTAHVALIEPESWLSQARYDAVYNPCDVYVGRFAPSPSGFLHQGSLVAAMASYLHARWHQGQWLVRLEDVDTSRCTHAYGLAQLSTLHHLGFIFDEPVIWQSERTKDYRDAFMFLKNHQRIYPCTCSRKDIVKNHPTKVHDFNLCQLGLAQGKPIRSWRFCVDDVPITWQNGNEIIREVLSDNDCDFVIHRPPDEWTYQLAVVVDDAAQGVTHVVRGADLLTATARQISLQNALNLARPIYNHFPILYNDIGKKLSKSEQAPALSSLDALASLMYAWCFLGGRAFPVQSITEFWQTVL